MSTQPRLTYREFESPLTALPMSELTASGLFYELWKPMPRERKRIAINGRVLLVRFEPDASRITMGWGEGLWLWKAYWTPPSRTPMGTRRYFSCPVTERLVNSLYITEAYEIGTRYELRHIGKFRSVRRWCDIASLKDELFGSLRRGPARGANRLRIVKRLDALGALDRRDPRILHAMRPLTQPGSAQADPDWPDFERWDFLKGYRHFERLLQLYRSNTYFEPLQVSRGVLNQPLTPTDKVDVFTMAQFKWLKENLSREFSGELTLLHAERRQRLRLFSYRERGDEALFVGVTTVFGQEVFQRIQLQTGAHKARLYFVCPVTGERTEKLYLRADRLAGKKAQRLVYPSQRA